LKRNLGLDIVRSIAIFLVMLAHSGFPHYFGIKFGELGVEIFFVLSGFLIGKILIQDFSVPTTTKTLIRFWSRRWFRTLPMYYLVVIFTFIVIDHSLGYKALVYFFFLQNNFVGITLMPVSWSLVIEEWFYISIPILFFILFRKGIQYNKLVRFLILFIITELILRIAWVYATNRQWEAIVGNFPFRLDSLAIGVLLSALKLFQTKTYNILNKPVVFILAFILFILLQIAMGHANNNDITNTVYWTRTVFFSLQSFLIACLIPFVEANKTLNAIPKKNPVLFCFTWISILSYTMYLIHSLVYDFVYQSSFFNTMGAGKIFFANLFVILLSFLLYNFYEKPMTNLRDKIKWDSINTSKP
jgi:peptidoglycan/LPS O-acetylase OafA/YrhL